MVEVRVGEIPEGGEDSGIRVDPSVGVAGFDTVADG
jgi:hypothetical protein